MKHISSIVDTLRKGVIEGARITREEASSSPLELVDETSPRHVDLVEKQFIKKLEITPRRPRTEVLALDSSSRVVETPYMFIALSAGSIYSRFTGGSIDVPSLQSLLGLEEPRCKHIVVVPEVEESVLTPGSLAKIPGVLAYNPLGLPYTSSYNKYAILNELRLTVEQCLLEELTRSNITSGGTVLLIDGPLVYPTVVAPEQVIPAHEKKLYVEAVDQLNRARVLLLKKLVESGVLVISVVKRLNKSFILSTVNPMGLAQGKMSDETYLSTLVLVEKDLQGHHFVLGPLIIKQKPEYGVDRTVWYIGISRRIYPLRGGLGNYVFYRIETIENTQEDEVLGFIAYDSIHTGSTLPLSILVVDKRVKKLTSSMVNYLLYLTGLSGEATVRYISMF